MTYDAIVIGGGALGTFHAYHLGQKGKKVLLIEKDPTPREATVRNFGQVVPSGFPVGRWHYYGRYSTQLYKEIQEKNEIGIRNNGTLYVASDSSEMEVLLEMHERFNAVDYPSEIYSKEQVLNHCDKFNPEYVVGGLFFEQEVSAESRMMISELHKYIASTLPVEFRYRKAAISIDSKGDKTKVHLAGGEIVEAEKVFVCNGRDFNILYPELFENANIEVSKLQMLSSKPVDFKIPGNILTGLSIRRYESFKSCDAHKNLDPANAKKHLADWGIHILFKQTPEGHLVMGDSHVYADVQTGFDAGFDEEEHINQLIINESKHILPNVDIKIEKTWSGFYSQMKGKEEIFEHNIDNKVFISTAIGGKGMTASAGYANEKINEIYG